MLKELADLEQQTEPLMQELEESLWQRAGLSS
jgi:hypothetical protein